MPTLEHNPILEKIAKLLRASEGARDVGSMEEAEAFAAKVQQLLIQYDVSLADVDQGERDREAPIGHEIVFPSDFGMAPKRHIVSWKSTLAAAVSQTNGCYSCAISGTDAIAFVGRPANRAVTVHLWIYLVRQLERIGERAYRAELERRRKRRVKGKSGWRSSYYGAAVAAIYGRLALARHEASIAAGDRYAIVLDDRRRTAEYAGVELGARILDRKQPKMVESAARAGYAAGSSLPINQALTPPTPHQQPLLFAAEGT